MNIDNIWDTVIAMILALSGGISRMLVLKNKQELRMPIIISRLFVSAFTGYMMLLVARWVGLNGDAVGFIAGAGGLMGAQGLDFIVEIAQNKLRLLLGLKEPEDANTEAQE